MGELKVIGGKELKRHDFFFGESIFSITFLLVGNAEGVSVPVIFLIKRYLIHFRVRGTNLVTTYVFLEGYCIVPNKT